ncbi:MAG: DUF917 domain-containing protein, partial [Sulfobacillus thermotolerans]|nr:DUF917 domain-containing protein [Sulfobacillus thermotolerans]
VGAAILGTGGGGDPYIGQVMATEALRAHGPLEILDVNEISQEQWILAIAGMGAPTVLFEKPPAGDEPTRAFLALERHLNISHAFPCPIEAGGINSLIPIAVASHLQRPLVDADGMGRAFPELDMVTFHAFGQLGTPACITNEFGDVVILDKVHDNRMLEWIARGITIRMGGHAFLAQFPMQGRQLHQSAIRGTLHLALHLGQAVIRARKHHNDPVAAIASSTNIEGYGLGRILLHGKIIEVVRRTTEGFARGTVTIQGTPPNKDILYVDFQNENLVVRQGTHDFIATVPDLITLVDPITGQAITTERLRYGQRVAVLLIPAPPIMKTKNTLEIWGPRRFGYDIDYVPISTT